MNLERSYLISWLIEMTSRRYTALGITLGIIFGGGFGMTVLDNIALGGLVGLVLGLIFGAALDAQAKKF